MHKTGRGMDRIREVVNGVIRVDKFVETGVNPLWVTCH